MLEIVDYSESLKQSVAELILNIQRVEFGFDISEKDQPDLLEVGSFYQVGTGGFWVALSEGKVVGTIALRDMGNFQTALRKMFVKASHRGKEHAVAIKLLSHLIARAKADGVQDVFLGTTEKFLAAHRFYEKNAFRLVAPEALPLAFPRMSVDTRFYHRTLHGTSIHRR